MSNIANHELLANVCCKTRHLDGVAMEFGVYRGHSLRVICEAMPSKMVCGLDSFRGLPEPESCDGNHAGMFSDTSEEMVHKHLAPLTNYMLISGWYADTLPMVDIPRVAMAHLDCDYYASYRDVLKWLWPRVAAGGQILCDDYGAPSCCGAMEAVNEWLDQRVGVATRRYDSRLVISKSSNE